MTDTFDKLADLYQVLGALMEQWEELGIKTEHMDALVEVQRLGAPDSGSNA